LAVFIPLPKLAVCRHTQYAKCEDVCVYPTTLVRPEKAQRGGRNGVGAHDPRKPGCFVSIGGSGVEARAVGRSVVVRVGRPWRPGTEWRLERPCLVSRRYLWVGVWLCLHYIPPLRGRLLLWSRLLRVPGDCAHGPVGRSATGV
jgi:hypothetical protein